MTAIRLGIQEIAELLVEFVLFVLTLCLISSVLGREVDRGCFLSAAALWATAVIYRAIYLQLPLSFVCKMVLARKCGKTRPSLRSMVNMATFAFLFLIATYFGDVVAGFVDQPASYFAVGILLAATGLSPFLLPRVALQRLNETPGSDQ